MSAILFLAALALGNDSMRIEFADADRGYGITGVVCRAAGNVRFVGDAGGKTDDFWRLAFARRERPGVYGEAATLSNRSACRRKRVERKGDELSFVWEGLSLPGEPGAVDVTATVSLPSGDRDSQWTINVKNRSKRLALFRTRYPFLNRVLADGEGESLLPAETQGAELIRGRRSSDSPKRRYGSHGYFPMVSAFMKDGGGLYFAAHDKRALIKSLWIEGEQNVSFEAFVENAGELGRAAGSPGFAVTVGCYRGDWWQAARKYRTWARTAPWCAKGPIVRRKDYPRAFAETGLWLNFHGNSAAALEMMTAARRTYPDFNTGFHWHCWNLPGHDTNYPEFFPAVAGVSNAVARMKADGQMPMIYTNGRLWDGLTSGWLLASRFAARRSDGRPCMEQYANRRPQGVMCPATDVWLSVMTNLAERITGPEIGAPVLFMDQIGAAGAWHCFDPNHGHPVGNGRYWTAGYARLLEISHALTFANGAALTTEGSCEYYLPSVDGCLVVTRRSPDDVPFFPAVYSGYTTYFATPENERDEPDAWRAYQTRELLWGLAPGWHSVHFMTEKRMERIRGVTGELARFRLANLDCLAYGTLEDELRFEKALPTVRFTWGGRWPTPKQAKVVDLPAVIGTVWTSASGASVAFAANLTDKRQAFSAANGPCAGQRLTLAPYELKRIGGLTAFAPAEGETVPVLTPAQRAFFDLPRAERRTAFADAHVRSKMKVQGWYPAMTRLSWSGGRPPFAVSVRKEDGKVHLATNIPDRVVLADNLEVACRYRWQVADADGAVRRATFRTEDRAPRFLRIPGIPNTRDFGGRIGRDGRRIRQGLVYRTGGLNENAPCRFYTFCELRKLYDEGRLSTHYRNVAASNAAVRLDRLFREGKATEYDAGPDFTVPDSFSPGTTRVTDENRDLLLKTLGIRTDLDLRSEEECWGMTCSPLGLSVSWINVSSADYADMGLDWGKQAFARAFRLFLDESRYPILFHCIAGQDRTGSLAFVLNGLLGVSEDELYRDWEASGFCNDSPKLRHDLKFDKLVGVFDAFAGKDLNARIEAYVRACGITEKEIARFREIMLEEKNK